MTTAKTILNQLGGNMFLAVTGAKGLVDLGDGLRVGLRRGTTKNKATAMIIRLNELDLYDVEFIKIRGCDMTTISKQENLYCDMLVENFETETGLYARL